MITLFAQEGQQQPQPETNQPPVEETGGFLSSIGDLLQALFQSIPLEQLGAVAGLGLIVWMIYYFIDDMGK